MTIGRCVDGRGRIELLFKWINQNLRIEVILRRREDASVTQVWIAARAYLLEMMASRGAVGSLLI